MKINTAEDITIWLHMQKNWIQEATVRLLKNRELSNEDIEDLLTLIKTEEGQQVSTYRDFPELNTSVGIGNVLSFNSIGNIVGIENLSPKKPLIFNHNNLVVVYGHNGSGKSSYSKIIKNISGKPRAPELRANVFSPVQTEKKCEISYSKNGQTQTIEWKVGDGVLDDLRSVDIFDTEEAEYYLNKEKVSSYTPYVLKLFESLAQVCDVIKFRLQDEQSKLKSNLPSLPPSIINTDIAKSYLNLTHNLSEIQVKEFITWNEGDEQSLGKLIVRLQENDHIAKAKQSRQKKNQTEKIITTLQQTLTSYSLVRIKEIYSLKAISDEKQKIASQAALTLESQLVGVGTDTWKAMWEAAREYSQTYAYKGQNFPVILAAKCVLCQQDISSYTGFRLQKFESFVQGKLEQDAKLAYQTYQKCLSTLMDVYSPEIVNEICENSGLGEDWKIAVNNFFDAVRVLKKAVILNTAFENLPPLYDMSESINILTDYIQNLEKNALQFEQDAQKIDRDALEKDKLSLEARKWISEQAESIKNEIIRLRNIETYNKWIASTNSKPISTKANQLAEIIITEAYVDRFNTELKLLGANKIKVELVKTKAIKGTVLHKLQLKDTNTNVSVESILSEGERRIISLAAFLADVTHNPIISPFIFDDPICSLDQIWEEKTIQRLIQLSKKRQVIIFTHRLSLLGMIMDKEDSTNCIHIRQEPWGVGETSEIPLFGKKPEKALIDLKNRRLVHARKAYDNDGYEVYYPLAKAICSDLRILAERIVELVFLADVIQRHRRQLNTLGKINKLAYIKKEDCDFIGEIMTKYSSFEHSQSDESPVEIPPPNELELDISNIIEWHTEFSKRAA
ncbi:AAA family ATPase [Acinetobacter soli]|uniref:AAA family ATPase n=2 Tax=Acinetobacter soli TaxID=487316 RepID=UPI001250188A|nr:restriction endonuclease [Acinetobacter soli]